MNKIKLNNSIICFIPILVFLPISLQIIYKFHLGGIDLFFDFLKSALIPKINNEIIYILIKRLNETIFISILSWIISINLGIIFGVLSSDIFYNFIKIPILIKVFIRFILTIIRSLHEFIWCLILIQIFGMNLSIGILAICIPFTAINAKVIREQIDLINSKKIESIKNLEANRFISLITILWSTISKTLNNFGAYRLECCIRSTSILGLFGIGGIGTSLFLSFQALNFREMWTYLWSLVFLIIIFNYLLNKLKIVKIKPLVFTVFLLISIFISAFYTFFILNSILNYKTIQILFLNKNIFSNNYLIFNNFLFSIFETIILSISATAIAISLPPFLLLISQNRYFIYFLKVIAFYLRLIPPPILILILLMFNEPSLSLAIITLGIHNAAITFKLLNKNLNQLEDSNYIAMKSIGLSDRLSWLFGMFSMQFKSYLSYCSYRSDILIRETAIVGLVGSIGIGWHLNESIGSFAWNEVIIILCTYSSIAIFGELINGKIKSKLN